MTTQNFLTREAILAKATQRKTEKVEVPRWESTVFVREMTIRERDRFEAVLAGKRIPGTDRFEDTRTYLVTYCTVDSGGMRLFTDEDMDAVAEMTHDMVAPIVEAAIRLNKLSGEDAEELEKN